MENKAIDDYSHRFHAGNVGDVFKHTALLQLLRSCTRNNESVHYIESHAGEGGYALETTGEWTEGVGKLWASAAHFVEYETTGSYLEVIHRVAQGRRYYPGSPLFAAAHLRSGDRLTLWEHSVSAFAQLKTSLNEDTRASIRFGDGVAALPDGVVSAEREGGSVVVLVDPPYSTKSEWITVPDALIAAYRASTRACFMLWYPLKSLTRPNALIMRLRDAEVEGTVVEWTNTPLELKRNRLNGSGLIFLRPPKGLVSGLFGFLPSLAEGCATHNGRWSIRVVHF